MARMSLQTAFDQARQWLETNDPDRAIGMAHHILETYPHCLEAHQMLGEAHLSSRQYEDARADFERVLQFDPEHVPALVGLGMTCERLGQLDRAISAFERALEIKPDLPELRNQLLRLYTDAWGSEYAHLRLSRAGLARLYAKGHMLPQAISEFRQVVADQPDRLDARVALAEALWRDEQEEDAAEACRAILEKHPHALKANLILGYIELASGNPSGEYYWKTAAAIDPYQVMARTLFESLPPVDVPDPELPEWDEAEWLNRQVSVPAEQLAATHPMEATTPTAVSVPPPPPPASPPTYDDSDDFLASLLAIDAAPPIVSHPVEETDVEISADTRPFTLEELGLSEAELASLGALEEEMPASADVSAQAEPATATPAPEEPADIGAPKPFSLEELGLTPEEIAALDSASASPPAAEEAADISAMQPFSLEELGLTPEEIASLSGETIISTPESAQPEDVDIDMQPFSLDDIDLEGIGRTPAAGLDVAGLSAGDVPPDLQPFSIEELETGSMSGQADLGELPPSLQPFSLDEPPAPQRPRMAGLTPEEAIESPVEEEETFLPRGFSWQQPAQRTEPSFFQSTSAPSTPETGTIFSKLQKQRESVRLPRAEEPPMPPIAPDEHLGLFSLDNVSLRDDESLESEVPSATAAPVVEEQPQPVVPSDMAGQPATADISTPSAPGEQLQAISLEDVESIESAIASGVIQPFSFADLGLTEEEIAALGLSAAPEAPAAQAETGIPTQEEPPATLTPPAEAPVAPSAPERMSKTLEEVESIEEALASGQLQPFSFADLGLTAEEIAALGLGDEGGAAQPSASVEPETREEPAPEMEVIAVQPISETFVEPATVAEKAPEVEAPSEPVAEEALSIEDLQPFSLADLGLSEEELAEFDLAGLEEAGGEYDERRLGLTEEELAALGTGGDLEWAPEPAPVSEPSTAAFEPVGSAPESISDDDVVNRLIQIGRERGYVDIADIIAAVKDPEAEAARIDEIGRRLHAARIEIRDGDEIIDLDEEYAEEEASATPESAASAAFEAEEEDLMRPFSLEELGLSDDEIAMLAAAASRAEEAPAPPAEEPPLAPFSLEELGLSDDEIALLNETAAATSAPPPSSVAPELDATSWFDLEPVVEESEAAAPPEPPDLDLKEAQPPITTPAPAPPPAAPVPPTPSPAPSVAAVQTPAPPPAQPSEAIHDLRDYPDLQEYLQMLESDPDNHLLRLSIARVGGQVGMLEIAMQHYRRLIKQNVLLDEIVEDLTDMIAETSDTNLLRKLHRTLGDAYSRQGRFRDAMREYSWIPGQG
ncbi:MAG: tetratricopeptide repeat protein [Roseiflexaceae bacterium]|nr:tetratricopeptide repeat protein [Roseiflexaceae bacterium]